MRLLRAEVSEREKRRTLAESEEPHREANWRRSGASEVRVEGQVLGTASPVATGSHQVRTALSPLLKTTLALQFGSRIDGKLPRLTPRPHGLGLAKRDPPEVFESWVELAVDGKYFHVA